MRLADRLRALDDRTVWVDAPKPKLTPANTLLLGLLAVGVYVGWALVWSWPLALLGVAVLAGVLTAIARFWFATPASAPIMPKTPLKPAGLDAERRPGVAGGRVGDDVDEVRRPRVEATT